MGFFAQPPEKVYSRDYPTLDTLYRLSPTFMPKCTLSNLIPDHPMPDLTLLW
jgi:hypothetical protein